MNKIILWISRIYGGLISLFFGGGFVLVAIGSLFSEDSSNLTPLLLIFEMIVPITFLLLAILTFIYSTWKKKHLIGGIWINIFAVAMFLAIFFAKIFLYPGFERLNGGLMGGLIYGVPFLVLGNLYVLVGLQEKRHLAN